jgi:Family of unknown function (DUF5677)
VTDNQVDEIIELVKELSNLTQNVIGEAVTMELSDHFGFMLLAFSVRQLEHSKSLIGLFKTGNFRDTAIIARIMLEGFAYLQWVSQKPGIRAYRWRAFGWVIDFRNLQEREKLGMKIDQNYKCRVENELKNHRNILLKPIYLQTLEQNLPFDPYIKEWTIDENGSTVSPKKILTNIQLSLPLKNAFEKTSKRVHWQPQDLSIKWESNEATFASQEKADVWGPCTIVILTLRANLSLFIDKFNLQFDKALIKFDDKFQQLSIKVAANNS